MEYNDDMTVEEAVKAMKAKESRKVKKPKSKSKDDKKPKGFIGTTIEAGKAYLKNIEDKMEERTGSKSMRKKHRSKKK